MKPNLNLELLFSNTDSCIYAIKTDDIYRDLEKLKADFDFSNYDEFHFFRGFQQESCAEVQRRDWWEAHQRNHYLKTETEFDRA